LTPRSNAYGSIFYTITSLHGSHVAVGLMMLLFVQVRAWLGHFRAGNDVTVHNASMYWHFVDVVWLFVFTCLYLSPHWYG
jgi:heme/copper-type cytochrome/quinol oxidase subunit 3